MSSLQKAGQEPPCRRGRLPHKAADTLLNCGVALLGQGPHDLPAYNRRNRTTLEPVVLKRRVTALRRRPVHIVVPLAIQIEYRYVSRSAHPQHSPIE